MNIFSYGVHGPPQPPETLQEKIERLKKIHFKRGLDESLQGIEPSDELMQRQLQKQIAEQLFDRMLGAGAHRLPH